MQQRCVSICVLVLAVAFAVGVNADECSPSPCLNGGSCAVSNATGTLAQCTCTPRFTGVNCTEAACVDGGHYVFAGGATTDSLAITTGVNLIGNTAFSVALWVRASGAVTGRSTAQYVMTSGGLPTTSQVTFVMGYTPSGQFGFGFASTMESAAQTGVAKTAATFENDTGVWHHWVGVFSGIGAKQIYRDGVLQPLANSGNDGSYWPGFGTLFIAYSPLLPSYSFAGALDEVRIWRGVLSASEVSAGVTFGLWSNASLVLHLAFSPLNVYDQSAQGLVTLVTGNPTYESRATPNGADCTHFPCIGAPCGALGHGTCAGINNNTYPQCTCSSTWTGNACQFAVNTEVPPTDDDDGGINLSQGAVIGIGVAAAVVFAVIVIASITYCRMAYQNPIKPAGVSGAAPGQALPEGVKTAEQLHAIQNESALAPVAVTTDAAAGVPLPGGAAVGAHPSGGHRNSIEMHAIGIDPTAASVVGSRGSVVFSPADGSGIEIRPATGAGTVEMLPIPPALQRPPSLGPPPNNPPLSRQPSDQLPGENLPFVRLASESTNRGTSALLPTDSLVLSRNSSEQSTSGAAVPASTVPAGAPPLIRGDSLKAVLMNKRRDQICSKCQTRNDEGAAFCSNCAEFFTKAPASPRAAGAATGGSAGQPADL